MLIEHMKATYPHIPAHVLDCATSLSSPPASIAPALGPGSFTKLFSNAALHWILRQPASRRPFFSACRELLQPGGVLVSESGALGNIAEVHAAIVGALAKRGVPMDKARDACPWWFPSVEEMQGVFEGAGLEWVRGEVELRQTRLTEEEGGGVEGWVRLFGAPFAKAFDGIEGVDGEQKWEECVREVKEVLEAVGRRADGGFQVNYVRLRFVARRPL
jgi:hypothetical protein